MKSPGASNIKTALKNSTEFMVVSENGNMHHKKRRDITVIPVNKVISLENAETEIKALEDIIGTPANKVNFRNALGGTFKIPQLIYRRGNEETNVYLGFCQKLAEPTQQNRIGKLTCLLNCDYRAKCPYVMK